MKQSGRMVGLALSLLLGSGAGALAGGADVIDATATREASGTWRFDVTVRHDDTGWEHYADRFEVHAADGQLLGTRVLHHPHENEQPFTRSLGGIVLPPDVKVVVIRAHDNQHGFDGRSFRLHLEE